MESTPFSIFCDTICRNHFRYWDHLRSNLGIICGTGIICGPGSFAGPYRSAINDLPEIRIDLSVSGSNKSCSELSTLLVSEMDLRAVEEEYNFSSARQAILSTLDLQHV